MTQSLNNISSGERLLIDANIFIYAAKQKSDQSKELIIGCSERKFEGIITSSILSEVMHVLMIDEARESGMITRGNPAKQLSERPESVKVLNHYSGIIQGILRIGLTITENTADDFYHALYIQRLYGLLTNDALIVAAANRLGITAIASADRCFSGIDGIEHYIPEDLG